MDELINEELTNEVIQKELIVLAREGKVYGTCPKCTIPLDMDELMDTVCKTCGQFDMLDVLWYPMESQPDS